jgi:hypothetical protein
MDKKIIICGKSYGSLLSRGQITNTLLTDRFTFRVISSNANSVPFPQQRLSPAFLFRLALPMDKFSSRFWIYIRFPEGFIERMK